LKKNILSFIVALVAATLVYLFLAPVPINPAAWTPQTAPARTGQYEQNSRLASVERLNVGNGHKPEDVAIDADGKIYAGVEDGRIIQLGADGTQPRTYSNTEGRPLGLVFDRDGNLIVADAIKGLLSINKRGEVKLLADRADDGVKFGCLNDLDVAADGTIYFTEASNKFPMTQHVNDLLEHQPNGRLLAFDPKKGTARTLLKGLYFANGVAVSPNQSFVLVAETGKYRVLRVWLNAVTLNATKPLEPEAYNASHVDVFIDNLPGFPDGISSTVTAANANSATVNAFGNKFWLALVTPRQPLFDRLLPHPFLRKVVYRLPKSFQPAPERYSFVLALDQQGHVVDNLQNGSVGCYAQIANVIEHNSTLYFGSIGEDTVGRFTLR
jgi:sugar lactone lactonase YvrE